MPATDEKNYAALVLAAKRPPRGGEPDPEDVISEDSAGDELGAEGGDDEEILFTDVAREVRTAMQTGNDRAFAEALKSAIEICLHRGGDI